MTLEDAANKVRLNGHAGPHPELYHKRVTSRLQDSVSRCRKTETCRANLMEELAKIADELMTPGSPLRRLIVKTGE